MSEITGFLRRLRFEKNYSQNTISAYQQDLIFCQNHIKTNLENATSEQIFDYLVSLKAQYLLDEKSISRKISCLRSFYKDLMRLDIRQNNPMDTIDTPKIKRSLPKIISEEELDKIFTLFLHNNNKPQFAHLRDAMIFELLYSCGLRVTELCDLKLNCIYIEENILRIIGKGDKERLVPIGKNLKELLAVYLPIRAEYLNNTFCEYLITSKFKKRVSRMFIWKTIKTYSKDLNITELNPHMLRHAFATHMLYHGADIRVIQELLGHSDLSTTEIYTHVENSALIKTVTEHHPLAKQSL